MLAAALIPIVGVFQIFDGLQVGLDRILRGVGETRTALIVNSLGFWLLGLPVSLFLGFQLGVRADRIVVGAGGGGRGPAGAGPDAVRR